MKSLGRRVLALVALCCALIPVAPASAQDDPVAITTGAGANWGVKASFRSYIVGPIAKGSIAVEGGATVNPDGTYHFPVKGGAYDPLTGATVVEFAGAVHFTGHGGQLDMKVTNPRVELTVDGTSLFADVASKTSMEATEITQFPNVRVGAIDLADKAPEVAGGKTTWTGLEQVLTAEAVSAFAGFYSAGAVLDPITFGYDGPGGRPQIEKWAAPGAPAFGRLAAAKLTTGAGGLAFDPARGRVWSSSYDQRSLTALRDTDFSVIGSVQWGAGEFFNPRNVTVDPTTGVAYGVDAQLRRTSETGGVFSADASFTESLGGGASNAVTSGPDGAIYTIAQDRLIRVKNGVREVFTLPLYEDRPYEYVTVLADGSIFVYGQFSVIPIRKVTLSGATATVADIPGTLGVTAPAFTSDGSLYYVEQDYTSVPVARRLWHVKKTATGYDRRQVPGISTGIGGYYIATGDEGKTLYVGDEAIRNVSVIRDGQLVTTIAGPGTLSDIEASANGDVYVVWRTGDIARLGQVGTTPAFTAAPVDAAVEAGAAATFTATASGDDAPVITWQTRVPGTTRWSDAATGTTFTLAAPVLGTRVRAVATNAHGAVVSGVVTVTRKPPVETPVDDTPSAGEAPVVLPAPVPAPPVVTPAPVTVVVRPATFTAPKSAKVGGKRQAAVLSLTCGSAACSLTAPKTVKVKIGGRTYIATVSAPKRLAAGKKGTVRVRLTAAAYRALRGKKTTAKVRVVLTADGKRTVRTVSVSLKR